MSHTNSTANLSLPQFIGTDKPTWLSDVNGAFAAIDSYAGSNDAALAITDGKADTAIADASNAVTTAGNAATTAGNAAATATAANTVAGNALTVANGINAKVGVLTDLTTTDKSTVVNAINEVNGKDAGDIAYDNTGSGLSATNVQDAIDEVAQGGGGGSTGYSLIWTNADPTQAIDTSTPLSIADADEYTDFVFEMVANNAYISHPIMVSAANLGSVTNQVGYPVQSGGATGYVYRDFTTTSSTMILDVPKIKSLSDWTDTSQTASNYIPVKIYGKK